MALTVSQAAQAGQLAAQAQGLQAALSAIQTAITSGYSITSIELNTSAGPMGAPIPISGADSQTLFATAVNIYQGMLSAVTAQLAAM